MVLSPHEAPSRRDGTGSCCSHPQLDQEIGKKKTQPNNKIHRIILTFQWEATERKSVDSLAAVQREDHSQLLQVVGRTLHNVTFLKGKYFNAQKKETAEKGSHLSLLVCSSYAQIVRQFESHFWDD